MMQSRSGGGEARNQGQHLDEDICLDLLHNLLPPAERDEVLAHIGVCPACESLLKERAAQYERLRARGVPETAIAGQAAEEPVGESATHALRIRAAVLTVARRRLFQLAGVAAVALAVVLSLWPAYRAPVMVASEVYLLKTGIRDVRLRGAIDAASAEQLAAAVEAYGNLDFEAAVKILRRLELPRGFEDFRKIYLGSSLAWMERYSEAVDALETVDIETIPEPWSGEAGWTHYVALKKSGDPVRADSLLVILTRYDGDVGDRARRISERTQ